MRLVATSRLRFARGTRHDAAQGTGDCVPTLRANPGFARLLQNTLQERSKADASSEAERIMEGRFRFLRQEWRLPDPVDWRLDGDKELSRLWRFQLQYHEFLIGLAAQSLVAGEGEAAVLLDRAWSLVTQWIAHNPESDASSRRDAWHPYCISRRLPVWMLLWNAAPRDGETGKLVLGSMASQARFLERHLEWDVRGNHLFENAKALALAGAFFGGPEADRWLRKGTELLRGQIGEQILPCGLHFEQSPMYHAQVLGGVLDVHDALKPIVSDFAEFLAATATRMGNFLRDVLHPDGEIPLLGDSCFGEAPRAQSLLVRVQGLGGSATGTGPQKDPVAPASADRPAHCLGQYWVFRDGGDFLLFDAAPVGPDYLPAHAHADLLGVEASVAGHRLFVDSGVFCYEDDTMRRYCRSTAAHNTLEIDGTNQCDVWSRFRMGYRGWPSPLATGQSEGFQWARASHNAYRRLKVPRVGRWLACRPGGPWLCVDWAEGRKQHQLSSWLHLHPEVVAEKTAEDEVRLNLHGLPLRLRYLTPGAVSISKGWYCPEFGVRIPSLALRWTNTTELPAVSGWSLTWGDCRGGASLQGDARCSLKVYWNDAGQRRPLFPIG